jgi:hypothetical protein
MPTKTNIINADYKSHSYWAEEANEDWFMTKLLEQLAITYL